MARRIGPHRSFDAHALGLRYFSILKNVVLPQAFRLSLPSTVGFLVQVIKGTSLSAIVGLTELSRSGQLISNATYQPLLVFGAVRRSTSQFAGGVLLSSRLEKKLHSVY